MDPQTPDILRLIRSPLHILGLVAVIFGGVIAGAAVNLPKDQAWLVVVLAAIIFILVLVTLYGLEHLRTTALRVGTDQVRVQIIPTRAEMYRTCARLLSTCHEIRDTTWGRFPRPLNDAETAARREYRSAVDDALKTGKVYRELFNFLDDTAELAAEAAEKSARNPYYEAKRITTDLSRFSILDFMVGDDSKVILSHVDARHLVPMYLYVESRDIAKLFLGLFQECWSDAEALSTTPND